MEEMGDLLIILPKNHRNKRTFQGTTELWGTSNLAKTKDALGFGAYQSLQGKLNKFSYYVSGSYEKTGTKYDADGLVLLPTYGLDNTAIYSTMAKLQYQISDRQKITASGNLYKTVQNTPFIPVPANFEVI